MARRVEAGEPLWRSDDADWEGYTSPPVERLPWCGKAPAGSGRGRRNDAPFPPKPCRGCGVTLSRRTYASGKRESWSDYQQRACCSRGCVGLTKRKRTG